MNNYAAVAFFLAMSVIVGAYTVSTESTTLHEDMVSANVIVNNGCSGTMVDKTAGLILTAAHCFGGKPVGTGVAIKKKFTADGYDQVQTMVGTVVAIRPEVDLAIVKLNGTVHPFSYAPKIRATPVKLGEVAFSVGNPAFQFDTLLKGIVSKQVRKFTIGGVQRLAFQLDAGIAPGSSGGAVYDKDGYLIGVNSAGIPGSVIGLAVPVGFIIEILRDYRKQEEGEAP